MRNCIFLDNHDLDRFYSVIGEDFSKYKMAINLLLTQRGIPQLYYGSEILMKNFKNPTDAEVRRDFPGGWPGDAVNKFTAAGRTAQENEAYVYIKALANFRKTAKAIGSGKLMQYLPKDGVYTYFRYDKNQTVMVISHTGGQPFRPDWNYLSERTNGFTRLRNVITGDVIPITGFHIFDQILSLFLLALQRRGNTAFIDIDNIHFSGDPAAEHSRNRDTEDHTG